MLDIRLYLAIHNGGIVLPFLHLQNETDALPGMALAFRGNSAIIPFVLGTVASWLLVYSIYKSRVGLIAAIACGMVIGAVPGLFYLAMSDALQFPIPTSAMILTGLITGAVATACVHAMENRRRGKPMFGGVPHHPDQPPN